MKQKMILLLAVVFTLLSFPESARADGIIIPDPPCPGPLPCPIPLPVSMKSLEIRFHHVKVTIEDQIAVTHVEQVFHNPNTRDIEGTYIFPLPPDAVVTAFTLWIDGKPVSGEILDADQARQKYEEMVNKWRDPALLEYVGQGAMQARVFPIPADGERRIELEYSQALAVENGLVGYRYPLNTEKFSATPLESVSINLKVTSSHPIRAAYSTSHNVDVQHADNHHYTISYEESQVTPDKDFVVYFSVGETEAFHLLAYPPDIMDGDGYFLILLAPQPAEEQEKQPKDLILVLDRSGSMEGEKFQQAQEALRYILDHLNAEDRFNLIAFSSGMESYATGLRPATEAAEARQWVDRLNAQGSTDIQRALLEAARMVDRERPTYLIFLTDGLPTEGVTDSQQIIDALATAAPKTLRLFSFGVGVDVDTFLLDSLAQEHQGKSVYVQPGERLDEALSGFYASIQTPVLTDLKLDFAGVDVYDLYPSPLPDLFKGSQIVVAGRYRAGGEVLVTLKGEMGGKKQTFRYGDLIFPKTIAKTAGTNDPLANIPRLWATRKIGSLLREIRLHGANKEIIDQIVRLSIRYGIVTPYTSYLVSEKLPLGAAGQERIVEQQYSQMMEAAPTTASGAEAVQKAADQANLAGAQAPAEISGEAAQQVKILGARTFVLQGNRWVDSAYDPERMQAVKVPFLSQEYFRLAQSSPELAAAFALGEKVIALANGTAYEVVEANAIANAPQAPPTSTPISPTAAEAPIGLNTPVPTMSGASAPAQTTTTPAIPTNPGLCTGIFAIVGAMAATKLRKR